jgi:hypothetical protein
MPINLNIDTKTLLTALLSGLLGVLGTSVVFVTQGLLRYELSKDVDKQAKEVSEILGSSKQIEATLVDRNKEAADLLKRIGEHRSAAAENAGAIEALARDKANEVAKVLASNKDFVKLTAEGLESKLSAKIDQLDTRLKAVVSEVIVAAGAVDRTGTTLRQAGKLGSVSRQQAGTYRVTFTEPLRTTPIAVAISDGGQYGSFAEITAIDSRGFTVEGRTYSAHGLADIGFQFVVVQPDR